MSPFTHYKRRGTPYLHKSPFANNFGLIPSFEYDPANHRFTFPVQVRPDDDTRLTLLGFYGAEGVKCTPIVLHYQNDQSNTHRLDPSYGARAKAAAKDPRLQKLLAAMKRARADDHSGIETVETISLERRKDAFDRIAAQTATFKWQGTHLVYADITGPMAMTKAFILGSDGQTCWLYSMGDDGKKRVDQTPVAVTETRYVVADPFDLTHKTVQEVLAEHNMVYGGEATLEGRSCYRLVKWDVAVNFGMGSASQIEWWIDAKTFLLRQMVQYSTWGGQIVRFDYRDLNVPLPKSAFQPPPGAQAGAHSLFFKQKPAPDEQRFLWISDGSNGRMSGRIGWQGPNGRTSSGMN